MYTNSLQNDFLIIIITTISAYFLESKVPVLECGKAEILLNFSTEIISNLS
jgi:hypothetical protein